MLHPNKVDIIDLTHKQLQVESYIFVEQLWVTYVNHATLNNSIYVISRKYYDKTNKGI